MIRREARPLHGATKIAGWVRPHLPEATGGILTSAGICEGFAGAGVSRGVLAFAGFAGLVAGTLAMGAVEYTKPRAGSGRRAAQLSALAFAAGALLPWLAIVLLPGPSRSAVTFVIVLGALVLAGWVTARASGVHPVRPVLRTAAIGALSMLVTYLAGLLVNP
jgi:VIT1/CCC1 family predicted Fe2+/Mn2+ transporter